MFRGNGGGLGRGSCPVVQPSRQTGSVRETFVQLLGTPRNSTSRTQKTQVSQFASGGRPTRLIDAKRNGSTSDRRHPSQKPRDTRRRNERHSKRIGIRPPGKTLASHSCGADTRSKNAQSHLFLFADHCFGVRNRDSSRQSRLDVHVPGPLGRGKRRFFGSQTQNPAEKEIHPSGSNGSKRQQRRSGKRPNANPGDDSGSDARGDGAVGHPGFGHGSRGDHPTCRDGPFDYGRANHRPQHCRGLRRRPQRVFDSRDDGGATATKGWQRAI